MKTIRTNLAQSSKEGICERFKESLELLQLTPSQVYRKLNYDTPSTIYSILAKRCLPDITKLDDLSKIKSPGGFRINLDWLITGKGKKLIAAQKREGSLELDALLSRCSPKKLNAINTLLS